MAFDFDSFVKENTSQKKSSGGFDFDSFVNQNTKNSGGDGMFNFQNFLRENSTLQVSNRSLGSSQGLYNFASQKGLGNQANTILKNYEGEKPKEFFSGGFISDIFDAVNVLDYGVVGMLKGKSFSEGIKTRQSFADKDSFGSSGLPGVIVGTLLDIAVDPFTYIAPYTIVKKIPFASKILKGVKELAVGKNVEKVIEGTGKTFETVEGGTKLGKYLSSKFSWMFGADPIFRESWERSTKNIAISSQAISDLSKTVSEITPEISKKILSRDETGRFIRTPLEKLADLKPKEIEAVASLYQKIDGLGKEAVDLGLLSKEKYEENIGQYIKNAYEEYEKVNKKGLFGFSKTGIKGIKSRVEGLTPEKMKELGQIDNPAYLLFKSAIDLTRDVENAKLFKTVAEKFGTDVAQEGFTKMPVGQRLGQVAGKYIPDNMATYLNEIIRPVEDNLGKRLLASFKFNKVILNPATHARNIVSNKVLNYWKLGMNPLDPRVIKSDSVALKEIFKGNGKWISEAKPLGYNLNNFATGEMKSILDGQEAKNLLGKFGGVWDNTKKTLGNIYQAEENHAKLSAYIFNRTTKGLSPEEAWKMAESATFNYAQVTPFVRKLRESVWGYPFITFTVKSTPVVAETIAKNPQRIGVIGKIKQSIENLSGIKETERERASEPPWVKNGFYIKLPMKDKEGRSAYFDLTYILPFGELLSGNFFERKVDRKTGLKEGLVTGLAKKSPLINLITEIGKNQDFYGNKIWKDSDPSERQLGDLMRHVSKTYLPPLVADQIPGGYDSKGQRTQRGVVGALKPKEREDQQRTLMQEMLRNVGIKINPVDVDIQETFQEWNKKKALETLLIENGFLNEINKTYIPK